MVLFELRKAGCSILHESSQQVTVRLPLEFSVHQLTCSMWRFRLLLTSSLAIFAFSLPLERSLRYCTLPEIHPAEQQVTLLFQYVNGQVHLQVKEILYLLWSQTLSIIGSHTR